MPFEPRSVSTCLKANLPPTAAGQPAVLHVFPARVLGWILWYRLGFQVRALVGLRSWGDGLTQSHGTKRIVAAWLGVLRISLLHALLCCSSCTSLSVCLRFISLVRSSSTSKLRRSATKKVARRTRTYAQAFLLNDIFSPNFVWFNAALSHHDHRSIKGFNFLDAYHIQADRRYSLLPNMHSVF
jgi:hypothetical protein